MPSSISDNHTFCTMASQVITTISLYLNQNKTLACQNNKPLTFGLFTILAQLDPYRIPLYHNKEYFIFMQFLSSCNASTTLLNSLRSQQSFGKTPMGFENLGTKVVLISASLQVHLLQHSVIFLVLKTGPQFPQPLTYFLYYQKIQF